MAGIEPRFAFDAGEGANTFKNESESVDKHGKMGGPISLWPLVGALQPQSNIDPLAYLRLGNLLLAIAHVDYKI